MTVPLIVLAFLAIVGGFLGIPEALGGGNALHQWLHPIFANAERILPAHHETSHAMEYILMAASVAIAFSGFWIGRSMYLRNPQADSAIKAKLGGAYTLLSRKYLIDELYMNTIVNPLVRVSDRFLTRIMDQRIIDGLVNGIAGFTGNLSAAMRLVQTGVVQNYASMLVLGVIIVFGLILLGL